MSGRLDVAFSDPQAVARYAEGPPRNVPGYHALLDMTAILLAERAPLDARILVLGAGGGLELKALAQAHPDWRFDGVDPSAAMLDLARQTLGPLAARACLHQGFVDAAPAGPFDGATCLLTLHFVGLEERRRIAAELRRRLQPGAPLVVAHFSFPQGGGERARWLSRYAAFVRARGVAAERVGQACAAIDAQLTILTPAQDEALLREAGFPQVELFYAGLAFRGWVAYA